MSNTIVAQPPAVRTSILFDFAAQTVTITHRGHVHTYTERRWSRHDFSMHLYWQRKRWITKHLADNTQALWIRKSDKQIETDARREDAARQRRAANRPFTRQTISPGWLRNRRASAGY